ncbi:MAG TPA: hypothetical protein VJY39_13385 [Acidisphaera sp.]|nr:hypothetical protein [Acidisphaera sp.]
MNTVVTVRVAGCLALGALAWGCSAPPPAPAPAPPVSYDGQYVGTVQLASGGPECATNPHVSWQVSGNRFTYVQLHPKAAGTAPALTAQSTSATYAVTILPDGTITGDSGNLNGSISGRVTGTHMSGQISGLLCGYTFTADRV